MKTPKKKIILGILLGILVMGGGFFVLKKDRSNPQFSSSDVELKPVIAEERDKDSDADGLKDWEEILWKTDPNNPDTDKDGATDGQEIEENRNPLLGGNGKNDKLGISKIDAENSVPELPPTLTRALAEEFAGIYLTSKQQNKEKFAENEQKALLDYLAGIMEKVGESQEAQSKAAERTKADIKIADKEDESAVKKYGNGLALIIKKYFDPIPESEMTVFQRALDNEDESELKKLVPIALAYRNTAKEALSLETTEALSESHLAIINSFNDIGRAIEEMEKTLSDPAQSILALGRYRKNAVAAHSSLRNLNTYFLNNKVAFGDKEPAKFFEFYQ